MPRQIPALTTEAAEFLGVEALAFLADEPGRLSRFLALTGLDPTGIRRLASEPSLLAAVLDHLAQDEALLTEFASRLGRDPAQINAARALLGGGEWERDTN